MSLRKLQDFIKKVTRIFFLPMPLPSTAGVGGGLPVGGENMLDKKDRS